MKEATYTLSEEVDGVSSLVLRAPTRKQLKFAAAVKSAFMATAMKMRDLAGDSDRSEGDEDKVLKGDEMLAALYAGEQDVGDLIDRFLSACTNTPLCRMNGGPVPSEFWESVPLEDLEGLFATFLENFITI